MQAAPLSTGPQKTAVLAESEDMQRERQYVRENSKFLRGQGFSAKAAAAQGRQLTVNADDYPAHLSLLGCHWNSALLNKPLSSALAMPGYRQQVFWLIRNHPESLLFSRQPLGVPRRYAATAFGADKMLWQTQLIKQPDSALLLGNAAEYYLLSEKALAAQYLLRAQALEPNNPEWPDKLGELHRLQGPDPSPAAVRQSAIKALAEYEAAASLANKTSQPNTSADLAKTAFDAGEYDKARRYAEALLQRGQSQQPNGHDSNDDVHAANLVLGLLALRDGDTTAAEAHLLAMGRVSGSPVLDSFGPNMRLAKELLAQKDSRPVLAYFDECAKFWTYQPGRVSLAAWTADVKQGKMPNFGSNLAY